MLQRNNKSRGVLLALKDADLVSGLIILVAKIYPLKPPPNDDMALSLKVSDTAAARPSVVGRLRTPQPLHLTTSDISDR